MSNEASWNGVKNEEKERQISGKMESHGENPKCNQQDRPDSKGEARSGVGLLAEPTTTAKKTFCCDECGKSFRKCSLLKYHQYIHTGEKPYRCDECGKDFRQLCDLKTHRLIHSGEKPYRCDECGEVFRQLSHLKNHRLIHSGEKPYRCDLCKTNFRQKNHLTSHQDSFKHWKKSIGL